MQNCFERVVIAALNCLDCYRFDVEINELTFMGALE